MKKLAVLGALALGLSAGVFAASSTTSTDSNSSASNTQPPRNHMGPPPEAFKVCEGKAEGAKVTLTMRDGKSIAATCKKPASKLVAVPDHMPPPPDGKGPQGGPGGDAPQGPPPGDQ